MKVVKKFQQGGEMEGQPLPEQMAAEQQAAQGGETVEESAEIFHRIISGKGTNEQNNVVCANAGMAIATVENSSILEGFEKAKESLLGRKALEKLKIVQDLSK